MEAITALEKSGLISVDRANGRGNRYVLIGVTCRHDQSGKSDQSANADQSEKADCTSREKPTTTSREKPIQNLSVESTKNLPSKKGRFAPPSEAEVIAYCQERKNNVDPMKFHAYYTSNGWKVGKNAMKDWKAAVRTWEQNSDKQEPQRKPKEFPRAAR